MRKAIELIGRAEKFACEKHRNQKKGSNTPFSDHLEAVVSRLKNLGVTNDDVLSAAWLHDTIEKTDTTFDELNEVFGNTISVLVLSLSKNFQLSKKERESQYVQQLKKATFETKLIKLCDISANLKDITNSSLSKNQKNKQVKKLFHYLRVIKKDLSENIIDYPKIRELIEKINIAGGKFKQRPITV